MSTVSVRVLEFTHAWTRWQLWPRGNTSLSLCTTLRVTAHFTRTFVTLGCFRTGFAPQIDEKFEAPLRGKWTGRDRST